MICKHDEHGFDSSCELYYESVVARVSGGQRNNHQTCYKTSNKQAMKPIVGVVRLAVILVVLLLGACCVLLAALLPVRIAGCRPAAWVTVLLARIFCWLFELDVHPQNKLKLHAHCGFLFANHQSYLDAIALLSLQPVRFLAAAEVRRYPVIGWIAMTIGTIFVQRDDQQSRKQTRQTIVIQSGQEPYPPIVLFPEGKLGPGVSLLPFRYGAFELAQTTRLPYLLCAIRYTPHEVAVWRGGSGESLLTAFWRLAQYRAPVRVELTFLDPPPLPPLADAPTLAQAAHHTLSTCLAEIL